MSSCCGPLPGLSTWSSGPSVRTIAGLHQTCPRLWDGLGTNQVSSPIRPVPTCPLCHFLFVSPSICTLLSVEPPHSPMDEPGGVARRQQPSKQGEGRAGACPAGVFTWLHGSEAVQVLSRRLLPAVVDTPNLGGRGFEPRPLCCTCQRALEQDAELQAASLVVQTLQDHLVALHVLHVLLRLKNMDVGDQSSSCCMKSIINT